MLIFLIGQITDCVYFNNNYYLYEKSTEAVYKKSIDDQDPSLFQETQLSSRNQNALRLGEPYSGGSLIMNCLDRYQVKSLRDPSKSLEFFIADKEIGEEIIDFQVFGKDKNCIVSITWFYSMKIQGYLTTSVAKSKDFYALKIHEFSLKDSKYTFLYQSTNLLKRAKKRYKGAETGLELPTSVKVCARGKFFFVSFCGVAAPKKLTRIVIFEFDHSSFNFIKVVDLEKYALENLKFYWECEFWGYRSHHLILFGITWDSSGSRVVVLDYDYLGNELREIEWLRRDLGLGFETPCCRFRRVEHLTYLTDMSGRVFQIDLGFD